MHLLYIQSTEIKNIEILSIEGKKLVETRNTVLNLNEFANGVYIVKVNTTAGSTIKKIVIN